MNKSLYKVFQIYVFVYAFLFASRPMGDADFWFHLKTGQYVFNMGGVPRTEPYSFTYHGIPYIAHGWLSGVIFYAIWSVAGPKLLIFIFAVLTALAFWIAFKRANSHPFIAGVAALVAVWTVLPNIGVRPRVFTILLASIFLALLDRFQRGVKERWIWLLVPLMALWANVHGGFFIGLALIGLTAVGMLFDYWAGVLEEPEKLRSRLRVLALVFVGCVLAVLVNPYGIKLYTAPIAVLRSSIFQDLVVDWLSPDFHLPTARPLLLLLLATTAVLALSPKRPKPSEVLLFLATLYATLKTQRNSVIFALVSAPLFANYFQIWIDSTRFGKAFGSGRADSNRRLAILFSVALLLPLVAFAIKLKSAVYSTPTQQSLRVPVQAVEYLKQNGITGNTFTAPNVWGAYVLWSAPNNPVYIDGRDVYPDTFVKEFVDITFGRIDWRGPFDQRGVKIVLIEPGTVLARELAEAPAWEKIYEDDMSVMFRRR
ncbi:MAG TPA: hypothetical protein VGJ37_08605 [Pyrinomonadaceae bacterium]|jgi:hypothetical protein